MENIAIEPPKAPPSHMGGLLARNVLSEVEPRLLEAAVQGEGGREEVWPLPKDVKEAIDNYLKVDGRQ